MASAFELLFQTPFEGSTLYKRQLELVYDLLHTLDSPYFVSETDESYNRKLIRLKTLLSQLFSSTVYRNVPQEFSLALQAVLKHKITDETLRSKVVEEIIKDLKLKNDFSKIDNKHSSVIDNLRSDYRAGSYVAIITGHPLEIEAESENLSDEFSIRQLFVNDLLSNLLSEEIVFKKYRILLPLENSCLLFWKGLREVLLRFLKQNRMNPLLIRNIRSKLGTSPIQAEIFSKEELISDSEINVLAASFLHFLSSEGFISVFWHTTPLFNLPTIAINPAEQRNAKVYVLMQSERNRPLIHRYSGEEVVLWRFFVWDRIKAKQFQGKRIDFDISSIVEQ